jgi:hypothetical protein
MLGITIQDKQIRSISGPSSVYFLRPKPHIYKDGNASNFPLLMLFGDYHFSTDRMCDNCKCDTKKNDEGKCCYKIYDPSFLQLLDTLADDKHPVDFYTETFQHGTLGRIVQGPLGNLIGDREFVTCYRRNLRGTSAYKTYCPTRYIRWHGGDPRQSGSYCGGFYGNQPSGIKGEDIIVTERYRKNMNIESQLFDITHAVSRNHNYSNSKIRAMFEETLWKTYSNFERFLISSIENPASFAQELFSMMTYENSVIYKQIMKQNYPGFRTVNDWAKLYLKNLVNFRLYDRTYYDTGATSMTKAKFYKLDNMLQKYYLEKILFSVNVALMDIYFMSRMLKQPYGGIRSSLSFGYFGDSHIKNVVRLLQEINVYDLVAFDQITPLFHGQPSRCKIIDFSLDLSEQVWVHNQAVDRENLKKPSPSSQLPPIKKSARKTKNCKEGEENHPLHPEKCRKICKMGMVRNETTGRCRKSTDKNIKNIKNIKKSVRKTKNCKEGEENHPLHPEKCRKICKIGMVRNETTGRCRKI